MGSTMKPNIQLDPKKLRHIRERFKQWPQKRVAQALAETGKSGKSAKSLLTMYQAIEHTGRTGPDRADAIAKILGVHREDLIATEAGEKLRGGTWWFEPPFPRNNVCGGMLLQSAFDVLDEVTQEFKHIPKPSGNAKTIVSLSRSGQEWILERTLENHSGRAWRCAFRPARKTDERGIGWMSASDPELGLFEPALIAFIYSNADVAILNGKRIPPVEAEQGICVEFVSGVPGRTPLFSSDGSRVYTDERLFVMSLLDHMREHSDWKVMTSDAMIYTAPQIEVRRMATDRNKPDYCYTFQYTITHVWRNAEGTWQPKPWPGREREELVQLITKREPRIWRHEDDEIPPFAPDTDP
jgi:hypothetical protein